MLSFTEDFPKKYECAINQIKERGLQLKIGLDTGIDYNSKTITKLDQTSKQMSPFVILMKGRSFINQDLVRSLCHLYGQKPYDYYFKYFFEGYNLDDYYREPVNTIANPHRKFAFALGRYLFQKYFNDRLFRLNFYPDILKKYGVKIE